MPAKDMTVSGYYVANSNTAYTVEHYQKDVGSETYTIIEADTELKEGTTGQLTKASAKRYTGFTAQEIKQEPIAPDGTTIVKVYYDRNKYNLTYSIIGDYFNQNPFMEHIYEFEEPIIPLDEPGRDGYTFRGWNNFPENMIMPANNGKVTGYYTVNKNTIYTIEHYQQNIYDDDYTLIETENLSGTTDTTATAKAKTYTGFIASSLPSGNIAGDGSLVLKVYYDRATCSVTFDSTGGSTVTPIENARYGTKIDIPVAPTREGYAFDGWYKDLSYASSSEWDFSNDQVIGNLVLFAKWNPNDNTSYEVEHYQQNIYDDNYTLKETESLSGTTDTTATATAKSYTGFKAPSSLPSGNIAGDGSLVIKVYYARETYSVTFDSAGGSTVGPIENARYGTEINIPSDPTRTGYTFTGWDTLIPATLPAEDLTITAQWDS
jgi:uncharacterized repeat protein (TIGR02543 family)